MNKKHTAGFSLIEIMVVVAILGIISVIAVPSYTEYVRKGKRADAKVELLKISQLQESYFAENLSYAQNFSSTRANGGLDLGTTVESEQGEYVITMTAADSGNGGCNGTPADSCASYVLTATPQGGQSNDHCKEFTITNTGAKDVPSAATGYDVKKCW